MATSDHRRLEAVHRIQQKFRTRKVEWLAAIQQTLIGFTLLLPGGTLEHSLGLSRMLEIFSEETWAVFFIVVGGGGLVALIVNGAMAVVTHWVRVTRAFIGAFAFALMGSTCIGSYLTGEAPPSLEIGLFHSMLIFELMSVYFAVADARSSHDDRKRINNDR